MESAREDGDGEAAHHRSGRVRHLHRRPGPGGAGSSAVVARRAAAAAGDPDGRADAARSDYPARHAGRQRRHHLDRGVQLLGRGQDPHGESHGRQRLHAGDDPAGADGSVVPSA